MITFKVIFASKYFLCIMMHIFMRKSLWRFPWMVRKYTVYNIKCKDKSRCKSKMYYIKNTSILKSNISPTKIFNLYKFHLCVSSNTYLCLWKLLRKSRFTFVNVIKMQTQMNKQTVSICIQEFTANNSTVSFQTLNSVTRISTLFLLLILHCNRNN